MRYEFLSKHEMKLLISIFTNISNHTQTYRLPCYHPLIKQFLKRLIKTNHSQIKQNFGPHTAVQ